MTFEQRSFKVSRPTIWNDLTAMMKDWIFQMEKSLIYWDLAHIFRCHFHQHHHLFWKQPFLPCSARHLLLARCLPRYEDMKSVHISLKLPIQAANQADLGKVCKCWHETAWFAAWMGNVQGHVDRYLKKIMVRRRNSTSTEEVARFQHLFPNPSWLTAGRTSSHKKTHSSIPMDRHLFMVTK